MVPPKIFLPTPPHHLRGRRRLGGWHELDRRSLGLGGWCLGRGHLHVALRLLQASNQKSKQFHMSKDKNKIDFMHHCIEVKQLRST